MLMRNFIIFDAFSAVSVKVNFVNPYHDALPVAEGAQNNSYSKWNFTLTPTYTSIHPGQNKIIAKFSCADNPNLISKATVNVTGVGTTPIVATTNTSKENNNTQQQLSSIAPPPQPTPDTATPLASSSANNNNNATTTTDAVSSDTTTTPTAVGTGNTDPKTLSASIHFGKNSIHPGDTQTITVKVSDKNSANTISGASVIGKITGPSSGILKKLEGTTNNNGVDTYSWKTGNDYTSGKYELKVDVSYHGYSEYSTSKTFKVIPLPVTSTSTGSNNVIPYYSSNIISSYPYSTDTNTNTNTYTDAKTYTNTNTGTNTNDHNTNTDTNTNHHHHSKIISSYPYSTDTNTNHHHHSKIISSYPYSTDTNTNTNSDTNSNTNANANTDTNTNHHHHSKIISSDTSVGSYSHYHSHSHKDVSSNDHTNTAKEGMGLNLGMGNLAQKIINDVKSKFESNWIQFP
jgi:hypothetical protein